MIHVHKTWMASGNRTGETLLTGVAFI